MNPEEGDLRPQLLDRFALSVEVRGIGDAAERMEILERHISYEAAPEQFRRKWQPQEEDLSQRIAAAREIVDEVRYTRRDLYTIASLTSSLHIDGHRADLVILKTARAHAAYEGRKHITQFDILLATELAIPHRLKRGPFADAQANMASLQTQIEQIESEFGAGGEETPGEAEEPMDGKKKANR
ncbi:MAG: magnesium chelatase, partial [Chloroflexi bacterium]|nr:magnesium chelatase [Chloroflexota bacterium]